MLTGRCPCGDVCTVEIDDASGCGGINLDTGERGVEERDALGKLDVRHVSITYVPRRRSSSEVASFRGVVRLTTSFADGAGAT